MNLSRKINYLKHRVRSSKFRDRNAKATPFEPQWEFYDLEKDPYELNNVISSAEYKDEIDKMKTILQNWRDETEDFSPDERQRNDNTDRITGVKFDQTRLPPRK